MQEYFRRLKVVPSLTHSLAHSLTYLLISGRNGLLIAAHFDNDAVIDALLKHNMDVDSTGLTHT